MSYDWTDQTEGPQRAPRIPPGLHLVRIFKVVHGKQNGELFQSKSGAPQMLVVFQDAEGQEASIMLTLSALAGWVLRKLLQCCYPVVNLAAMKEHGIKPEDFARPEFAQKQLLDRWTVIQVEAATDSKGEEYLNCMPARCPTEAEVRAASGGVQEEIPF